MRSRAEGLTAFNDDFMRHLCVGGQRMVQVVDAQHIAYHNRVVTLALPCLVPVLVGHILCFPGQRHTLNGQDRSQTVDG